MSGKASENKVELKGNKDALDVAQAYVDEIAE